MLARSARVKLHPKKNQENLFFESILISHVILQAISLQADQTDVEFINFGIRR